MNKALKAMLSAVMLLALLLMSVLCFRYISDRADLSSLKTDLEDSTAAWKKTNEEKIAIQKLLKNAKNDLREAELTISESEETSEKLNIEISELEKSIEELKTGLEVN